MIVFDCRQRSSSNQKLLRCTSQESRIHFSHGRRAISRDCGRSPMAVEVFYVHIDLAVERFDRSRNGVIVCLLW